MDEEIKLKVTVDTTAAKAEIEALRKELSELGIGEGPSNLGPGVAAGRVERATTRYEAASPGLGAGLNTRAEESVSLNSGALRAKYADWAGGVPGVTGHIPYSGYGPSSAQSSPIAGLAAAWGAEHVASAVRPQVPQGRVSGLRREGTAYTGRRGLPDFQREPRTAPTILSDDRSWVSEGGARYDSDGSYENTRGFAQSLGGGRPFVPGGSYALARWGGGDRLPARRPGSMGFDTPIDAEGRSIRSGSPISDEQYRNDWDRNRRLRALDAREPMSPGRGGSFWGALGRGAGFGGQSSLTSRLLLVGAAHETIGGITGAMAAMHEPTELKIQKELRLAQTSAHLHGSLWGLASGFGADAAAGSAGAVGKWALDKKVDADTAAATSGPAKSGGINWGNVLSKGVHGLAYGAAHGLEVIGSSGVGKTAGLLLGGALGSIEAARLAAVNRPAISTGKGLAGKLGEMFGEYAEATGYAMKGKSEAEIIAEQRKVLDPVAALLIDGQRGQSLLQDTIKQSVDKAQTDSGYDDQRYRDQRPPVGNDDGASESEQIKEILGKFAAIYDFLPKFEVLFGNMSGKLERAAQAAEKTAEKLRGGG